MTDVTLSAEYLSVSKPGRRRAGKQLHGVLLSCERGSLTRRHVSNPSGLRAGVRGDAARSGGPPQPARGAPHAAPPRRCRRRLAGPPPPVPAWILEGAAPPAGELLLLELVEPLLARSRRGRGCLRCGVRQRGSRAGPRPRSSCTGWSFAPSVWARACSARAAMTRWARWSSVRGTPRWCASTGVSSVPGRQRAASGRRGGWRPRAGLPRRARGRRRAPCRPGAGRPRWPSRR